MLYHVAERKTAAMEMRRVTNGQQHMRSLRALVEAAVSAATPGWQMRNPSTHAFSLENGEAQLRGAFGRVECVRPSAVAPVALTDASIAADYVASVGDHYQPETSRPWREIVEHVRATVQCEIDATGAFIVRGETGAFICA
jgi:hypothetical protein